MRLLGISSVVWALSLCMLAGSAHALPAPKSLDSSAEQTNLHHVHCRPYRHCHGRYRYRHCHGGYHRRHYRPFYFSYRYRPYRHHRF